MLVKITQDDIDNGTGGPYSGLACPVALAINRHLPYGSRAYVVPYGGIGCDEEDLGIFIERVNSPNIDRVRIESPEVVTEFTQEFDAWEGYQCADGGDYAPDPVPFEFELNFD